jgi:hypothetical protein
MLRYSLAADHERPEAPIIPIRALQVQLEAAEEWAEGQVVDVVVWEAGEEVWMMEMATV